MNAHIQYQTQSITFLETDHYLTIILSLLAVFITNVTKFSLSKLTTPLIHSFSKKNEQDGPIHQ
jgi:hypothetical protein